MTRTPVNVAVLVPCFNEASTVGAVVRDFRAAFPAARIYVYDNNSTDDTAAEARKAGAIVRAERAQGKGNVVRRMFADVEAEVYVMVDGDATYDAASAIGLVEHLVANSLDLVNGERVHENDLAYRSGHQLGNRLLSGLVARVFRPEFRDMLSGLKVFSRRFVKSFPALTRGFDIETELTVHALAMRMPVGEQPVPYRERPTGSESKLHTYRDGWRILRTIVRLLKEERPLLFFTLLACALTLLAVLLGIPLAITFIETGLVPRIPTAVIVVGLAVLAAISVTAGLILDTVSRGRVEMKRLVYLSLRPPAAPTERIAGGEGSANRGDAP